MLLREKGLSIKAVAPELDVSPSTLYDYCAGRLTFPPDLVASRYRATRDRRVLDFFADELGVVWFELPECAGEVGREILDQALTAQKEVVDVLQTTLEAAGDGVIDARELRKIRDEFWEALGALAKLLACAEGQARRAR
jgi:hypothetical protein